MHAELFDEMAALGITVTPGAMGENITTRGVPLLDLAPGTRLHLGETAVIEVTGCRNPCAQLNDVDVRLLGQVAQKPPTAPSSAKPASWPSSSPAAPSAPGDAIVVEAPQAPPRTRASNRCEAAPGCRTLRRCTIEQSREQIDDARVAFRQLMDAIEGMDEQALTAPGIGDWSVRDALAHITGWAQIRSETLRRMTRRTPFPPEGEERGTV